MTEGALPFPRVFDLHSESEAQSKRAKTLRQGYTVLSVIFVGALLWFVVLAATQGIAGLGWVVFPVVFLCLSALIGEFFILIWKTQPGAIAVTVLDQGIEFAWISGRADFLPWPMVARVVELQDYSVSGWDKAGLRDNWYLRRWNRPITRLSKTAFDTIVRAGAQKGLVVSERFSGTGPVRWVGYRIVRFR